MNVSLLVPHFPLTPYSVTVIIICPNFHVFSNLLLVSCEILANFSMLNNFYFVQFTHIKLLIRIHVVYAKPPLKLF